MTSGTKKWIISFAVFGFVIVTALAVMIVILSVRLARVENTGGANEEVWIPVDLRDYSSDFMIREVPIYFSAFTNDGHSVSGLVILQYHLVEQHINTALQEYGTVLNLQSMMNSAALHEVQNIISNMQVMQMFTERYLFVSNVRENLTEAVAPKFHVEFTSVFLENLSFNYEFISMLERIELARREIVLAEIQRDRDLIIAENAIELAIREAERMLILSEAEAGAMAMLQEFWDGISPEMRELLIRLLNEE